MDFLKRPWKGESKLWLVFWVYGIAFSIAFKLASFVILVAQPAIWPVIVAFALVYTLWWYVSLWRCAFNTRWKFFGYLARIWVIVAPLLVILSFVFNGVLMGQEKVRQVVCEKQLADYAMQNGMTEEQAKQYVVQNTAYVQQCVEAYGKNSKAAQK